MYFSWWFHQSCTMITLIHKTIKHSAVQHKQGPSETYAIIQWPTPTGPKMLIFYCHIYLLCVSSHDTNTLRILGSHPCLQILAGLNWIHTPGILMAEAITLI